MVALVAGDELAGEEHPGPGQPRPQQRAPGPARARARRGRGPARAGRCSAARACRPRGPGRADLAVQGADQPRQAPEARAQLTAAGPARWLSWLCSWPRLGRRRRRLGQQRAPRRQRDQRAAMTAHADRGAMAVTHSAGDRSAATPPTGLAVGLARCFALGDHQVAVRPGETRGSPVHPHLRAIRRSADASTATGASDRHDGLQPPRGQALAILRPGARRSRHHAVAADEAILARVRAVPRGFRAHLRRRLARSAALAGAVLSACQDPSVPWHRIVRADGSLAQGRRQRRLLEREGVPFRGERVVIAVARLPDGVIRRTGPLIWVQRELRLAARAARLSPRHRRGARGRCPSSADAASACCTC